MKLKKSKRRFRVVVIRTNGWRPKSWTDGPPSGEIIQAEGGEMRFSDAECFLCGYNSRAVRFWSGEWAVIVPARANANPGKRLRRRPAIYCTDCTLRPQKCG